VEAGLRISRLGAAVVVGAILAFVVPASAHRALISDVQAGGARTPKTIYDSSLHVTWLANMGLAKTRKFGLGKATSGLTPINQDGSMQYQTAKAWVRRLNQRDYLGHSNWTLPITQTPYVDSGCKGENRKGGGNFGLGCTKSPLAELYTKMLRLTGPDTAVSIPDATTGPFDDFQPYLYWTADAAANNAGFVTVSFNTP
jgi:hypothetical protein